MAVPGYSSVLLLLALLMNFSPMGSHAESLFPSRRGPLDVTRLMMSDVHSLVKNPGRHRLSRLRSNFQDCVRDVLKTEQEWFTYCEGVFQSVLDSRTVDNSTLEDFCKMNCSGRVWELTRKLITDCEYIPQPNLVHYDEVLEDACDDDGHGNLCVLDWANVNYTTIPGYVACAQAPDDTGECPDGCKEAIPVVLKVYGCCYHPIQKSPNRRIKYTISEEKFDLCRFKEPPRCT